MRDEVASLRADLYRARGVKGVKYPSPWPRPGVAPTKVRALNEAGRAYLQKLRDDHARLYPETVDQAETADGG